MGRTRRLSTYLAGNIALFAIPLLLASGWSLWTLKALVTRSFSEVASLSAQLLASRFEEFFARPREEIDRVSDLLRDEELYPPARLGEYLRDAVDDYPYLARIQIVDAGGRVRAVTPADPDMVGVSRRGEAVYEEVRASRALVWSESYISAEDNQPALSFGLAVDGSVILCDLDLAWVGDYAAGLRPSDASGATLRITDGKGVYLSHVDRLRVERRESMPDFRRLKARSGAAGPSTVREDGRVWLVSVARIPDPDWFVFVLYPESMFTDALFQAFLEFLGLALSVGAAGAWFWRARFRRITRLFAAIPAEADRISRGDYGPLEGFGEGFAEFERVGEGLNRMVAAIGRRERILFDREGGFRSTLERIDLAAIVVDAELRLTYANPFFLSRTGLSAAESLGTSILGLLSCGGGDCPFERAREGKAIAPLERCSLKNRQGGDLVFDWSIVPNLDAEGRPAGFTGIGHDLTGMVLSQARLSRSVREKEVLIREIHHRVKNNLQVILSLLHLQEAAASDSLVVRALREAGNRILSIALVHEAIYAAEDVVDLDFGAYAESLAGQLLAEAGQGRIELRARISPLRLDLPKAVPCGLFLNEALACVLGGGASPRVVELAVGMEGEVACVSVGVEALEAARPTDSEKGLLEALVDQLGGEFGLAREGGLRLSCRFRPPLRAGEGS